MFLFAKIAEPGKKLMSSEEKADHPYFFFKKIQLQFQIKILELEVEIC